MWPFDSSLPDCRIRWPRRGGDGLEVHRQLRFDGGGLIVRDVRHDARPPHEQDHSHETMVRVGDARAHCERARAAGATILTEPADYEYGERQYHARDPFGHRWVFTETLDDVAPEEWGGTSVRH